MEKIEGLDLNEIVNAATDQRLVTRRDEMICRVRALLEDRAIVADVVDTHTRVLHDNIAVGLAADEVLKKIAEGDWSAMPNVNNPFSSKLQHSDGCLNR